MKPQESTKKAVAVPPAESKPVTKNAVKNRNQILIKHWPLPLPLPPPGLKLYPHQESAIRFALERNRCYLGLDPGLGKTICAAMIAKAFDAYRTVYICPPFLVANVAAEFQKWWPGGCVHIVPDTKLHLMPPAADSSLLFVDEAHRFKNSSAKRTQSIFGANGAPGIFESFAKVVFLSGTPMPNRPAELWPVLKKAAPETIDHMSFREFALTYCGGYWDGYQFNTDGATNMRDLGKRVIYPAGPFMMRVRKSVLDLPPKLEEAFVIGDSNAVSFHETDIRRKFSAEDLVNGVAFEYQGHVASYRRLLGAHKAGPAAEYVADILKSTNENILLFAFHTEVIEKLEQGLSKFNPLVITGKTPSARRQGIVDQFQNDKKRRLIIGNYVAMGVGFNLTKADRVIFCEFDWVPGVNDQASDRAHRIGRGGSVLVQYVCFNGSLDKAVLETLFKKRKSINTFEEKET